MDFLPEYFCTMTVTFVFKGSLSFSENRIYPAKQKLVTEVQKDLLSVLKLSLIWLVDLELSNKAAPDFSCDALLYVRVCVWGRTFTDAYTDGLLSESLWKPFVTLCIFIKCNSKHDFVALWIGLMILYPPPNIKWLMMFDIFNANAGHYWAQDSCMTFNIFFGYYWRPKHTGYGTDLIHKWRCEKFIGLPLNRKMI